MTYQGLLQTMKQGRKHTLKKDTNLNIWIFVYKLVKKSTWHDRGVII